MNQTQPTTLCCPGCAYPFEAHLAVGATALAGILAPDPGSLLVCGACGEVSVMDESRLARRLSEEEAMQMPPPLMHLLAQVETARQAAHRKKGSDPFGSPSGGAA